MPRTNVAKWEFLRSQTRSIFGATACKKVKGGETGHAHPGQVDSVFTAVNGKYRRTDLGAWLANRRNYENVAASVPPVLAPLTKR